MAHYYPRFFEEIREAVISVWPETAVNGVYHTIESGMLPFERKGQEDRLPIAIVDYNLANDNTQGADNQSEVGPVTIYYITKREDGHFDQMFARLQALQNKLWETNFETGLLWETPQINFSIRLPLLNFFMQTQRPFWGGAVVAVYKLNEFVYGPTG